MKYNFIIFIFFLLLLVFIGCKDEVLVIFDCLKCWDRDMICVDVECDCLEESIEIWLELRIFFISNEFEVWKFCIMLLFKIFVVYVELFVCIDIFGLIFVEELWMVFFNEVGVFIGIFLVFEILDDVEYSFIR